MSQPRAPVGRKDHLFGAALCIAYVALLLGTSHGLAMSRDESFYVVAAERYGAWIELLARDPGSALARDAIDRAWSYNHEHPALMKTAFALSWLVQKHYQLFPDDSSAFRFPGMLTGGLLLWLIYVFGARLWGRPAGVFGALAFAFMPRVFYHAHLDCFDVPIVLMTTLTSYCYWRSLLQPRWAIATGLAFGLALATKHNSWVLPGIYGIHFAWMALVERGRVRAGSAPRVSGRPYWLPAMLLLGPAIFVGSWPWIWHDTLPRIGSYARFHLEHAYYNMAYFGHNYFRPPFPVSYPFVMTAFTVPLATLLLAVVGLGGQARALFPPRLADRLWPHGRVTADRRATDVLLVGCLFAPIVIIALPSTPIFGGTKHWFPAYPFLALYAGLGLMRAGRALRQRLPEALAREPRRAYLMAGALALAPSVADSLESHPFGLSNYTFVAGGAPGAADLGMNRQFWGFTTGSLADWFRERLPHGGTVWICDMTPIAWQMMQRDGLVPRNIRVARDMASADYALVHLEHHFAEVEYQAWVAFGTVRPVEVLTYDGVPIITVYGR